ncbi:unnamed protein product [Discosporangium mesarthrocarpum]
MRFPWGATGCSWLLHVAGVVAQRYDSVAVVGAGIGGSTASYFLKEQGSGVEITVFEASERAGGRTDVFVYDGVTYETGASIIYTGNAHIFNLTERLGLKRLPPRHSEDGNLGIWDGEKFALVTSSWKVANLFKMAWRYGRSLLTIRSMVNQALARFNRIYLIQAAGIAFSNPEELWGELGLLGLTKKTIADYMHEKVGRPGSPIELEIVHAVNRVNYNQGNNLNALAGVISLCPLITGDVFQVEGGNARLSEEALRESGADVRWNTTISRVVGGAGAGYSLYSGQEKVGTFSAVILAAPLELAKITLDIRGKDRTSEPRPPLPSVVYQEVHTTFVKGVIDRAYFNLGPGEEVPASVLLAEGAMTTPFSSLSLQSWVEGEGEGVGGEGGTGRQERLGIYKLFSRNKLWTGVVDSLFVQGSWEIIHHQKWLAYPKLPPRKVWVPQQEPAQDCTTGKNDCSAAVAWPQVQQRSSLPREIEFSPVILYPGHPIFYLNSLEEGVSAMEVSAIAAKNAALGVIQWLLEVDHGRNTVFGANENTGTEDHSGEGVEDGADGEL